MASIHRCVILVYRADVPILPLVCASHIGSPSVGHSDLFNSKLYTVFFRIRADVDQSNAWCLQANICVSIMCPSIRGFCHEAPHFHCQKLGRVSSPFPKEKPRNGVGDSLTTSLIIILNQEKLVAYPPLQDSFILPKAYRTINPPRSMLDPTKALVGLLGSHGPTRPDLSPNPQHKTCLHLRSYKKVMIVFHITVSRLAPGNHFRGQVTPSLAPKNSSFFQGV